MSRFLYPGIPFRKVGEEVKGWLQALPEEDRKPELMSAITAAQRTSDYVLDFALALPKKEEADLESSMTSFSRMRL